MAIVSANDVWPLLGGASGDQARMVALIDSIGANVAAQTGIELEPVEATVTMPGNWTPELRLGHSPVSAVDAVELNGEALVDGDDWYWPGTGPVLYRGPEPVGLTVNRTAYHWGGEASVVTVTYTHGWANVPERVRQVAIQAAVRNYGRDHTVRSTQLGDFAESYDSSGMFTEDELRILRRYRRRGWPRSGE